MGLFASILSHSLTTVFMQMKRFIPRPHLQHSVMNDLLIAPDACHLSSLVNVDLCCIWYNWSLHPSWPSRPLLGLLYTSLYSFLNIGLYSRFISSMMLPATKLVNLQDLSYFFGHDFRNTKGLCTLCRWRSVQNQPLITVNIKFRHYYSEIIKDTNTLQIL